MYKCTKTLKEGSFGEVYVAVNTVNLDTGKEVAVKRMKSAKSADQCIVIYREFDMMKSLKHPNILEAIDFYVCKKSIYLILEFADGGDLDDLLSERGRFPENVARVFFQQIVKGIRYIHSKQIAHLDIKDRESFLAGRYGQPGYVSVGCWCLIRKLIAVDPQARHSLTKISRSDEWLNTQQFQSEAFDIWLRNI